ncbi:hypothetical protein BKA70DRAFT_1417277 [Coprinopsis sp. MPI-PUGE-AT-0042]|nr:hypothetical protein BKA70DRAFT_1417277 [Coprinopsis sp. MPI-PUGE-AT-0042]
MPQKPLQLDKANNAYFVVTLSPSGSVYSTPAALSELHPSLKYVGQVGELEDTHMYSSPLDKEDVIATFLKERRQGREGIARVDFPEERDIYRRSKRDEFCYQLLGYLATRVSVKSIMYYTTRQSIWLANHDNAEWLNRTPCRPYVAQEPRLGDSSKLSLVAFPTFDSDSSLGKSSKEGKFDGTQCFMKEQRLR